MENAIYNEFAGHKRRVDGFDAPRTRVQRLLWPYFTFTLKVTVFVAGW